MTSKFYDGQAVRAEPNWRTDSSETEQLVWECPCPICSDTFEVRTPSRARTFEPSGRCQKRKRPGMRVKARGAA